MTRVNWLTYLPIFKYEKKDNATLHLVRFHMHVHKFQFEFPKDCFMKFFMAILEDGARTWYEGLQLRSLFSLRDFYRNFLEHYEKTHSSLSLLQGCCDFCEVFIPYLKIIGDNGECMDEDMLEALYDFSSHVICHDNQEAFQKKDVSYFLEDEMDQHFDSQVISYEIFENLQQLSQSLGDKEEHKDVQLQGSSLCSFSEPLNVEQHENGQEQGEAYVIHVYFIVKRRLIP